MSVVKQDWRLSWNLGWCYFKINQLAEARKHPVRAARLAPDEPVCHWALVTVYLHHKEYKKAEHSLLTSLRMKDAYMARVSLALAYLEQGKVAEAEEVHREGISLQPEERRRYEAYADFLSDIGREEQARRMYQQANRVKRKKR